MLAEITITKYQKVGYPKTAAILTIGGVIEKRIEEKEADELIGSLGLSYQSTVNHSKNIFKIIYK